MGVAASWVALEGVVIESVVGEAVVSEAVVSEAMAFAWGCCASEVVGSVAVVGESV